MTGLDPTSPPSSSGARLGGDDLQHLVAWYWCLKMVTPSSDIVAVGVEADVHGNLDDVTVEYADGRRHYIQVKASVSAAGLVNAGWLMHRRSPSAMSLIQKLYDSWDGLGRPADGVELVTSRPIDPDEPLLRGLGRKNTIGAALRRATDQRLSNARASLAGHIDCTEEDLCDFFDVLAFRIGQTEAEWSSRIADVAIGAGVRSDPPAELASLGWVREWVKDTRDTRGIGTVMAVIDELGLRVEPPRALVVIQGIDSVPADGAVETLHWTDRFRGDRPEMRRGLVDPADWNGALTDDLRAMKTRLSSRQYRRVLLRGALRLPCWFAIGATLREVANFDVAMDYRGQLWPADMTDLTLPIIQVRTDEAMGEGRTVVVVAISTDATDDVRSALVDSCTGRLVTVGLPDGPSPSSLNGPREAMAAALAVRDWVRRNVRNSELDLVLMAPAPFALFLGHVWDRIGPTTIHEDLLSSYEPAFRLSNTDD